MSKLAFCLKNNLYEIQTYRELPSTNTWLHEYAKKSAKDGLVIRAVHQTKGKGTQTNKWWVEPNTNLTFSILHKTPKNVVHRMGFCCANALVDFLANKGIEAKGKWPNDILVDNKKIAGILIENQSIKNVRYSTIGIGLNVNQTLFPENVAASSMKLVTDTNYELEGLLRDFLAVFSAHWQLLNQAAWQEIYDQFEENLWRKNQITVAEIDGKIQNTRILGITKEGLLRVEREDLPEKNFRPHTIRFKY